MYYRFYEKILSDYKYRLRLTVENRKPSEPTLTTGEADEKSSGINPTGLGERVLVLIIRFKPKLKSLGLT